LATERTFKNAQQLGETSLMFLVHPTLSEDNIKKTVDVIEKLKKVLDQ
jgi:dTDP-4-amino-4,6-dideoxygalactose transaminase